jgi:L-ascorbate metabolism protein UlaG (beta-lactamase superfamily)
MKIKDVDIDWLGHSSVRIKTKDKTIYIDPYQLTSSGKADMILITHSHYDHCSLQDIEKIVKDGTIIICTADSQSKITRIQKDIKIALVQPGSTLKIGKIKVHAIAAYNANKRFHQKSEGWVGFVFQFNSVVIYHAGDTDLISDMYKLTGYSKKGNYFVAFLPVGGTYTMNPEEAAKAASVIKPSLAIPMHYGNIVGNISHAKNFVEMCEGYGIKAKILEKK